MRPARFFLLPLFLFYRLAIIRGVAVLNNVTDAFIEKLLSEWGSPGGVAVAVVQRDDQGNWTVETKGYGVATANGSLVTDKTLFAVGSTSKVRLLSLTTDAKTEFVHSCSLPSPSDC